MKFADIKAKLEQLDEVKKMEYAKGVEPARVNKLIDRIALAKTKKQVDKVADYQETLRIALRGVNSNDMKKLGDYKTALEKL